MERMAGIMTFQHTMDLMGSKEAQRLVKEPTMHIVFIHGQEYNLHCFGVENCFSNLWASIEQSKLIWVRHHQKELRADDIYQGLRDAAMGDHNENFNLAEHGQ